MKQHLVVKMVARHPDDDAIADWIEFIDDKSKIRQHLNAEVDRIFRELGRRYWLTNEYAPAGIDWDAVESEHGLDRTYRIILQDDAALPPNIIDLLKQLHSVEDATPVTVRKADISSPPGWARSASFERRPDADLIGLAYARALTRGSPSVTIAVLDTGVGVEHPELIGKFRKGIDFVDLKGLDTTEFIADSLGVQKTERDFVGHGTHVSGILAARGLQMNEGIAPDCQLMAVRVLAAMKSGEHVVGAGIVDNINAGIKWSVDNGADIINMSLGIKHTAGGLPHEDVIRYALSRNVTVVAASGNDGSPERYYPGALPGVIAVGAVDERGNVASFTSYGADIFVVAPGMNIYSAYLDNSYAFASGTSQASPFVAGSVALMKSLAADRGKTLSNDDVRHVLKSTSDRVDSRMRNEHAGYGLVNLADAFKLLDHLL